MSQTFLSLLNDSLQRQAVKDRAWQLNNYDLVLLNKFHERSSLTVGSDKTRYVLQQEGLKLAFRVRGPYGGRRGAGGPVPPVCNMLPRTAR